MASPSTSPSSWAPTRAPADRPGRAPIVRRPAPVRGVVFLRKDHCKGCELCIEFCPKNVLTRSTDFNVKGYHYPVVSSRECINCRLCVTVCPEYAIFSVAAAAPAPTNGGGA